MIEWIEENGQRTKTVLYDNCIVVIHRPVLTQAERDRRMKQIHDAAARFIIAEYEAKRQKGIKR